jgi:hypothetical protein
MFETAIPLLVFLALICSGASCRAGPKDQAAIDQATKAAETWLKLIDAGEYRASHEQAGSLFRNAVTEEQWTQKVGAVREPLGPLASRKLKTAGYYTSLPGAPDGQYVVIQYDSSFAHKQSAVETITPMLEKDGGWRVSGYYIK